MDIPWTYASSPSFLHTGGEEAVRLCETSISYHADYIIYRDHANASLQPHWDGFAGSYTRQVNTFTKPSETHKCTHFQHEVLSSAHKASQQQVCGAAHGFILNPQRPVPPAGSHKALLPPRRTQVASGYRGHSHSLLRQSVIQLRAVGKLEDDTVKWSRQLFPSKSCSYCV